MRIAAVTTVALATWTSAALAEPVGPVKLTDVQMDRVVGGLHPTGINIPGVCFDCIVIPEDWAIIPLPKASGHDWVAVRRPTVERPVP